MAFGARQIAPIDTKPGTGVGVSIPFKAPGVFTTTYTTQKATQSNLINFFLTGKGERFLNPAFGTGLRNLLFENISKQNLDAIDGEVKESLRNYFPQVIPININTQGEPDRNSVTFSMRYQIQDTGIEDTVAINFELE